MMTIRTGYNRVDRVKSLATKIALHAVLILGCIIFLYPFLFMFLGSFKDTSEIFSVHPTFFPREGFKLTNYKTLLEVTKFGRAVLNSSIVSSTYTALTLLFCSMGGFGFSKYRFPGRNALFFLMLATMMLPFQAIVVPLFVITAKLGWANTYYPLIVPFLANPFGIFLMRQYMNSIPDELVDAGRIDGCSDFGLYYRIIVPVSRPALTVLGLILFMSSWNNFMWPLIVLSEDRMFTVPLALTKLVGLHREIQYGPILAGSFLGASILIILFLAFQRQFVEGIMSGAIKG
ncbi:MAG: carbohydrate ABC transporter permease [Firmicutes bacterium]|nr:carbohydrate ABC transporter permease [Bacillota bacterium]